MRQVAACLLVAGGVGFGAQGQTTYQISGTSGFIQDLDSADGVDLISGLAGTWEGSFTIPNPADLAFVSNTQNQGGSLTRYTGVTLNNLTIFADVLGDIEVSSSPIVGTLGLWDRQSFGSGQRQLDMTFNVLGTSVRFAFTVNNGGGAYDTLFLPGTPNPNVLLSSVLPLFENPAERAQNFNFVSVSVDGGVPILPGRGRYNGDATRLVPAPGAAVALGLCGLIAVRRRRG